MNNFIDSNNPDFTSFSSGFISGFRNDENHKRVQSMKMQEAGISRADQNPDKYKRLKETNKRMKFRIEEQEQEYEYNPEKREFPFYQICHFSMDGKKHKIRKIYYNEVGEILRHNEDLIKKSKLDKFLKKCPKYKYTIYPAYDLDIVGFPQNNEITMAMSQILNDYQ